MKNQFLILTKAIEGGLTDSDLFFKRGTAKYILKDYKGAFPDLDKAISSGTSSASSF